MPELVLASLKGREQPWALSISTLRDLDSHDGLPAHVIEGLQDPVTVGAHWL